MSRKKDIDVKMQDLLSKLYTDNKDVENEKISSCGSRLETLWNKYGHTVDECSQQPS